jgi:pimeloyl-ACP methyl ester carboxylesterase
MELFYRKVGVGNPFIILHGLFGQSDNWNTLAKQFSESGYEVYTVDLRNHGLSPHSDVWDYKTMSDDILELITTNHLQNVILLGHSMGGKVAMQFAIEHQEYLSKLIVVDIAPKYYAPHHQSILKALDAIDFKIIKTRKEATAILSDYIKEEGTKQFLLKNIYWNENEELAWRFNLKIISAEIEKVGEQSPTTSMCYTPTCFINGELSNYILESDIRLINNIFPNNMLETIKGAGHWVHAEKPKAFFDCVISFLK